MCSLYRSTVRCISSVRVLYVTGARTDACRAIVPTLSSLWSSVVTRSVCLVTDCHDDMRVMSGMTTHRVVFKNTSLMSERSRQRFHRSKSETRSRMSPRTAVRHSLSFERVCTARARAVFHGRCRHCRRRRFRAYLRSRPLMHGGPHT